MGTLTQPALSTLRTNVRNLLNQPSSTNSFWTDAELDVYLNEAVRVYYNMIATMDEGYFLSQSDLNITSGTETVALPTGTMWVKALYKKVDNGYVILPYRNNLTEGYVTNSAGDAGSYTPSYYFRDNDIVLRPPPTFTETNGLRIEYMGFPDTLVNDGDLLTNQIPAVYQQVVEAYAVYKAKLKESFVNNVDTAAHPKAHLSELTQQLKDTIVLRSKNPTAVIPFNPESEGV